MLKYFLLFFYLMVFTSCLDQDNFANNDRRVDQLNTTRSSSVRCSGSSNSSELSISKADNITSSNAGEYRMSGHCERSNDRIDISIENKGLEISCSGGRWNVNLDLTSVVQRRDVVNISVSGSGGSACASVDNRFNCPEGYIPVPRAIGYTERDFCVMEYEASSEYRRNDRYGGSRYGSSSRYDDGYGNSRNYNNEDDYYYDKAVSQSSNDPWTGISHVEAKEKCENNGVGYYLINNDDWQTIARHIESEHENWSLGRTVVRADNILNVGISLSGAYGSSRRGGSSSRWEIDKRSHILPNGEEIWDFSGGVWEFVLDAASSLGVRKESNKPVSELSGENKRLFGPKSNYNSLSDRNVNTREAPGGLGDAKLSTVKDYVARGGGTSERDMGVFSVRTDIDDRRSGASLRNIGFRCVFRP